MKRPIIISVVCVAAAVLLLLWGFGQTAPEAGGEAERYALVIRDDTGTFLMQLRKGMQAAADEAGVSLSVIGPGDLSTSSKYIALMVLAGVDSPRLSEFPTLYIGQTMKDAWCVLHGDSGTGVRLMERALALAPPGQTVLLVDGGNARAAARSGAAEAFAGTHGVQVMDYDTDGFTLPPNCAAAVAASPRATQALAAMKRSGTFDGAVLGVDTGDSRVADLEDGAVTVMALDNPYAMGYLALRKAREGVALTAEQLSAGYSPDPIVVDALLADQQNMYLPENVKQVFPLLQ